MLSLLSIPVQSRFCIVILHPSTGSMSVINSLSPTRLVPSFDDVDVSTPIRSSSAGVASSASAAASSTVTPVPLTIPTESTNFHSPTIALIDTQLRVAREILLSPPVQAARRTSTRWSQPLSPASLEHELSQATKQTRKNRLDACRRSRNSMVPQYHPVAVFENGIVHEEEDEGADGTKLALTHVSDPSEATAAGLDVDLPSADNALPTELQLHLKDPVTDNIGAALLATAITSSATSLTSLQAFVQHVGDPGAEALAEAFRTPGLMLKHADMRFRDLALTGASILCQGLVHLRLLESLTLRCCSLGDEGTRWLCAAFMQNDESRLAVLDLNENGITDIGCLALGQLLMRHQTLTTLSLEDNLIGTRGAYVLGKAMSAWRVDRHVLASSHDTAESSSAAFNSPTTSVDASHSSITSPAITDSSQSSSQPTSAFTSPAPLQTAIQPFPVPIAFTPMHQPAAASRKDGPNAASPMNGPIDETDEHEEDEEPLLLTDQLNAAFMATLDTLPSELPTGPSASPSAVTSAAHSRRTSTNPLPALPAPPKSSDPDEHPCMLQTLNLRFNKIDVNDMTVVPSSHGSSSLPRFSQPQAILARYLTVAPETSGLVHLDLSLNSMGDEGAVVLARSLAHNLSLKTLNVNYCHISDRGGIAISRALAFNNTLTALHLSLNYLTTDSAVSFSDSLGINSSLAFLDLSLNLLDDASMWSMCDSLGINTTITHLDVHSNFITDEGAEGLARACYRNSTLRHVNVDQNPVSEEGVEVIQLALFQEDRYAHTKKTLELRCAYLYCLDRLSLFCSFLFLFSSLFPLF